MKNQQGFTMISESILQIDYLGQAQLSFIQSVLGAFKSKQKINKSKLCKRANILPNHFNRYETFIDKHKNILGEFKNDKEFKKVLTAPILRKEKESFAKIPSVLITNKNLSKTMIGVLIGLNMFTNKGQEFRGNVYSFWKTFNYRMKKRNINFKLHLSATYKAIKKLKGLNLISFTRVSKQLNKTKAKKYFQNYITKIKLTDTYWNLLQKSNEYEPFELQDPPSKNNICISNKEEDLDLEETYQKLNI